MIKTPTVFVLGAGASAPYGFPLGSELVTKICHDLADHSNLLSAVHRAGFELSDMHRFRDDLAASGRSSIDAFLDKRREYLPIGKACIAAALIPAEQDAELSVVRIGLDPRVQLTESQNARLQARRSRRWYHYLFDRMLFNAELEDNNLTIVTFNFDRSFERALYNMVNANYGGSEESVRKRCKAVPIYHVHGALGTAAWLDPETAGCREYRGVNAVPPGDLRACADAIRIVHEECDTSTLRQVGHAIAQARRICFLGFSYHPLNLSKLDVERLASEARALIGTAFKMPKGPQNSVRQRFAGRLALHPAEDDILRFLQDSGVVDE